MSGMPSPTSRPRLARAGGAVAGAALAALALAACGGGAATPSATTPGTGAGRTGGAGNGAQRAPGVTGLIAAIEGTTMQVQSPTKQTAVGWTASTRITRSVDGTPADIVVGSCVVVRNVTTDATAGSAGGSSGPVSAASVQVSPPVNGSCLDAIGGAGGIRAGGGSPTGAPTDRPAGDQLPPGATGGPGAAGGPGARGFGGFGVVGQVMSKGDGEFVVASIGRAGDGGVVGATANATAATTPVTVTILAATTVKVTTVAAASDIKVGLCATALGVADDIGKVTATSIVLRDPVSGSCTTGGGLGGPGAPRVGGPGGAPTAGASNG